MASDTGCVVAADAIAKGAVGGAIAVDATGAIASDSGFGAIAVAATDVSPAIAGTGTAAADANKAHKSWRSMSFNCFCSRILQQSSTIIKSKHC